MGNIAIVPWGSVWLKDELFNLNNKLLNRDNGLLVWQRMKEYLYHNNINLHTIDMYSDIDTIDLFVFFYFDIQWYKKVCSLKSAKLAYIAFEPPVVDSNNSEKGLRFLKRYFDYIITWNDDLIDDKYFFKFMYPYIFTWEESRFALSPDEFDKKSLICNISGNKTSIGKNELYTERRKIIEYYDTREDFGLFGIGWDNGNRKYRAYQGTTDNKKNTYSGYKYAVCLENMKGIKGYITEKILDCFCAGIIPIYVGASNCVSYIPDNCYIHYESFETIEQLDNYIIGVDYEMYRDMLNNIRNYLESDRIGVFAPERLCDTLSVLLKLDKNVKHGSLLFYFGKKIINRIFSSLRKCVCKMNGCFTK